MRLTIHQPEFAPWLGFFHKVSLADALVILDDVQFRKNYFHNRNRVRTPEGWNWVTVPVEKAPLETPMNEVRRGNTPGKEGRDHHRFAFTMWMAGGGMKSGVNLGETDDLGFNIVRDRYHVHDLQATILHCLGIDHTRLTFRHQGRDFRLTDVGGQLIRPLLA